jgi:hypothetical protein
MSAAVTLAVAMLLTACAHGGEVRRMRHPAFSWRTVPVFAETSNVSGMFDEDAVQQLARFPLFVAEKVSGCAWRCALADRACAHTHMHAPRCGTLQAKPRSVRGWSLSSRSWHPLSRLHEHDRHHTDHVRTYARKQAPHRHQTMAANLFCEANHSCGH